MIMNKSIDKITVFLTKAVLNLLVACIIWISGCIINIVDIVVKIRIVSIKWKTMSGIVIIIFIVVPVVASTSNVICNCCNYEHKHIVDTYHTSHKRNNIKDQGNPSIKSSSLQITVSLSITSLYIYIYIYTCKHTNICVNNNNISY